MGSEIFAKMKEAKIAHNILVFRPQFTRLYKDIIS